MAETQNRTLLTMAEVAELTSLSQSTVRRLVKAGILPAPIRLGPTGRSIRFKLSDIQQYLNNI
ncbi:TPA: helix-turn-helix domain-containing protein [Aeromonas hydrophila subsp. hydrophila]|uniref:Transcriptional regulator n=3 Tax=Aeromonas hydrophila TaxID=644 RepID=A0ABD7G258_AERHY|nr:helix-turn-helix domain-containing protein [Aeromonas hydrophila]MBC8669305.1 helix-turn-helix domain-containing protein [Aeromonas hydrophila]MBC8689557.1 helix-turn-helix domain-containing protein [Aeromonas hydrophila]RCF44341.1 transcriptional regulator [Aeromonas hydrophila]